MKKSKNEASVTLADLADRVGGTVDGDGSVAVSDVATIEAAGPGHISFVANPSYRKFIETTGATALVLDHETPCERLPVIRHNQPYLAFATIIDIFHPPARFVPPGPDSSAVIANSATLGADTGIGPLCHVADHTRIGSNCQLVSSVTIGPDCEIGDNCILHPGVRILRGCRLGKNVILHAGVVVGSDGFGFAQSESGARKIQHRGSVKIEDDVEIGANSTIDRGVMGATRIGRGTKIDNLVQIAHNVQIGQHCLIVAQVGISGSTKIGNGVIIAGQVGITGHLEIGDGVKIGAQSGVSHSTEPGKVLFGSPARDFAAAKRIEASLSRLPDLLKRVRELEKQARQRDQD